MTPMDISVLNFPDRVSACLTYDTCFVDLERTTTGVNHCMYGYLAYELKDLDT